MKNLSLIILAIILAASVGAIVSFGQEPTVPSPPNSAPVKWTEYRISSQKVSIQLPKLPVKRSDSDPCSEIEGSGYHAYADGVVYEFAWYAKAQEPVPQQCPAKSKFSESSFTKRLNDLRFSKLGYVESAAEIGGRPARLMRSRSAEGSVVRTRWLIWQDDRWFELAITRRGDTAVDENRFTAGFKLLSSSGRDVASGADSTLGDADVDLKSNSDGKELAGIVVVTKPKPSYTDFARQTMTQGTVILRVVFLRNGGIGSISVAKALPNGLTEQAIAAAQKLSFLPATRDGKPINVVKMVEYTFSIY